MTSCQSSIQNGIKQQGQHLKKVPENKKFQILSNGVFSKPSEKGYLLDFTEQSQVCPIWLKLFQSTKME